MFLNSQAIFLLLNWSPVELAQHAVDLVEEPGGALGLGQVQPLGLRLDLAQLLQVLLVVLGRGGFNWIGCDVSLRNSR